MRMKEGKPVESVADKKDVLSVFLVDDSQVIQDHINLLLSELEGIEIVGRSGTVESAVDAILSEEPDVVLLDLHLRGENGLEVLHEIRSKKVETIVIVFTNYPYPSYRKACFKAGADFFFDKSLEFGQAIRIISDLRRRMTEND